MVMYFKIFYLLHLPETCMYTKYELIAQLVYVSAIIDVIYYNYLIVIVLAE